MSIVVDAASWALFIVGAAFVFVGGLGAVRLPSFYTRMHAAGLTDSLGTILVLGGAILQAGWTLAALKLFAILAFLMLTGPTATYALANAARLADTDAEGDRPRSGS